MTIPFDEALSASQVLAIAVDALRDLDLVMSPPPGTSMRAATVERAQSLIRAAVYKAHSDAKEPAA